MVTVVTTSALHTNKGERMDGLVCEQSPLQLANW